MARRSTSPFKKADDRQLPKPAETVGQSLGGVRTAPESALAVTGNERERGCGWTRDDLDDELGRLGRECSQPALLPGRYEDAGRTVVGNGRAGSSEGQPPTRALSAALYRPCGRRAASLAAWAGEEDERRAACGAQEPLTHTTGSAAAGQQQVDEGTKHELPPPGVGEP